MLHQTMINKLVILIMIVTAVLFLASCGPKARVAESQLDTPEHHMYTGLRLLNQEKYADAQREFELAIQLKAKYSKAYTGIALVNLGTGNFNAAWENLNLGLKYATADEEKVFVNVGKVE